MFNILLILALQSAQSGAAKDLSHPPRLANPRDTVKFDDFPKAALRRDEFGIVSTVVQVSASGEITSCAITETSGSDSLDATTCALLKRRARFDPATNSTGQRTVGQYRSAMSWGLDSHQPSTSINLPLEVSKVPADYQRALQARLLFDASGRVTDCSIMETSGSAAADRVACTYAKRQISVAAPKSKSADVPPVAVRYLDVSLSQQVSNPNTRP